MFRRIDNSRIPAVVCTTLSLVFFFAATAKQQAHAQEKPEAKAVDKNESSREALLVFAEAAGFQNNKQFDLAATEWAKFMELHAKDPRATEALYNLAICQIQERGFKEAAENLERVTERAAPDFPRLEDAYLNLGWSQYSVALENQPEFFATAADTFSQLLQKYPKSKFRDQALFFGGESLYLQGKFEKAVERYSELVEKHDDSDLHSDAMYALGVTMEDLRRFKDAGEIFAAFMKLYPKHDLATEVKMRKAETILQGGDFNAAEKLFAEVAAISDYRALDHAKFRHAFCIAAKADGISQNGELSPEQRQQQVDGYRKAAEIFSQISKDMPDSPYAQDAAMAAGRSYYRAQDYNDAVKWFQQIEASDSPAAPEAAHWHARVLLNDDKPAEVREVIASVLPIAEKASHPYLVNLKLDEADALYKEDATKEASVAAYLKIANDHPDHRLAPKALYNAAYGAMELKDYETGLAHADRFQDNFAKHTLGPEVRKVIAECKLQLGELDGAAQEYGKLVKAGDKEAMKFEIRRGLSLYLKKDFQAAIDIFDKVYDATEVADEKAEAAYWTGRSHTDLKDYEQAIVAFENSQQANPKWRQADEVQLNLGRALRKVNRLDDAKTVVRKMISDFPESTFLDQANYRLGEFSYASGDYKNAIENYSEVIASWPDSNLIPFSLYGRGWSQLRSGVQGSGLADFQKLATDFPDHELANQSIYGRGMAEHQNGEHQKGLASVEEFLKTQPTGSSKSDAMYLKGVCLIGLQQLPAAVETFTTLLKSDPKYAGTDKVLYELAWAYKNGKDDTNALATFNRLASAAPKSPLAAEAHYHVGEEFYTAKKYADAITKYTAANTLAKTNDLKEKSAYKLGWAQYQTGKYEEAVAAFDQQLGVNGESNLAADAEFMRAESFFKAEQFSDAFNAYERARQKPSKNPTMQLLTLLHGGQAAGQLKQWDTSKKWLADLLRKAPKSPYIPQASYEIGWAQRNLGELDSALKTFAQVATSSRNELGARARFMIGEVLFEQKNYSRAILEFRRVMFGYGAENANEKIKQWQAKSGFEAGRCATVLASQEQNPNTRSQLLEGAKAFFRYVVTKHPEAKEVKAAREQLQRLEPAGSRANRPTANPGI